MVSWIFSAHCSGEKKKKCFFSFLYYFFSHANSRSIFTLVIFTLSFSLSASYSLCFAVFFFLLESSFLWIWCFWNTVFHYISEGFIDFFDCLFNCNYLTIFTCCLAIACSKWSLSGGKIWIWHIHTVFLIILLLPMLVFILYAIK